MKRNWTRTIIGGLSFSSALFVFQACYGMPQDLMDDLYLEGMVTSRTTGLPIEGIKVTIGEYLQYAFTNEEGRYSMHTGRKDQLSLLFEDIDAEEHGIFASRDTLVTASGEPALEVNMVLEEK